MQNYNRFRVFTSFQTEVPLSFHCCFVFSLCSFADVVTFDLHFQTRSCKDSLSRSRCLASYRCNAGNLNGHYYNGPHQAMSDDGVVWYTWHGWHYSIKSVVMMVRASDLQQQQQPVLANMPPGLEVRTAAGGEPSRG